MATGLYETNQAWLNRPIQPYFPGSSAAGFNPNQLQGWQQQMGAGDWGGLLGLFMGGQMAGYMGQGPQMDPRALAMAQAGMGAYGQRLGQGVQVDPMAAHAAQAGFGAYDKMLQQGPQWNPYLDQVVQNYQNQMGRQFNENILPGLRGTAVNANAAGGSASSLAMRQAAGDLNRTVGEQTGSLLASGFSDTQNRYQNLLGMAPQMAQMAAMPQAMARQEYQNLLGMAPNMTAMAAIPGQQAQDNYLRAMGMAPGLFGNAAQLAMMPGMTRAQIGGTQQQQAQNILQGEMQRWMYPETAGRQRLDDYNRWMQGVPGASSFMQTQSSYAPNTMPGNVAGLLSFTSPYWGNWFGGGGTNTAYSPAAQSSWMNTQAALF